MLSLSFSLSNQKKEKPYYIYKMYLLTLVFKIGKKAIERFSFHEKIENHQSSIKLFQLISKRTKRSSLGI